MKSKVIYIWTKFNFIFHPSWRLHTIVFVGQFRWIPIPCMSHIERFRFRGQNFLLRRKSYIKAEIFLWVHERWYYGANKFEIQWYWVKRKTRSANLIKRIIWSVTGWRKKIRHRYVVYGKKYWYLDSNLVGDLWRNFFTTYKS